MKITYDKSVDAAYIYLTNGSIAVKKTYCCDPQEVNGQINLDFNSSGVLVGIEVLDASKKLSPSFLKSADVIG